MALRMGTHCFRLVHSPIQTVHNPQRYAVRITQSIYHPQRYSPHQWCGNVKVVHEVVQSEVYVFHGAELVEVLGVVAARVLLPTPAVHFLDLKVGQSFRAVHGCQDGSVVTQSKQVATVDVKCQTCA